jgi:hypothetical protein
MRNADSYTLFLLFVVAVAIPVSLFSAFILRQSQQDAEASDDVRFIETAGEISEYEENSIIDPSEILSGGVAKDGIPSIDDPQFISVVEADEFVNEDGFGLGIVIDGEARYYPNQILVWHEIVNDTINGVPVLITYCPLCATSIAYERRIEGEAVEFGVSGQLWRSNLLMYNRSEDPKEESLWSQILGQAVTGKFAGDELDILESDVVTYSQWKQAHPDTLVLSRDTGADRNYSEDPYEGYYTSDEVGFGATFDDDRLDPKALVYGVEVDGNFKAYPSELLVEGANITDNFAGEEIVITVSENRETRFYLEREAGRQDLPYIPAFWFSWAAVHQDTEVYDQ